MQSESHSSGISVFIEYCSFFARYIVVGFPDLPNYSEKPRLSGEHMPVSEAMAMTDNPTTTTSTFVNRRLDDISKCHEDHGNVTLFSDYPPSLLDFGATCCIVFAIVGVIGNFISIVVFSKSPRLRQSTTAFIVNLCVAHFLFCSFSLPLSAATFVGRSWYYGGTLCKLFPLIHYANASVTIFSIVAVTFNRYILLAHPTVYYPMYTRNYIGFVIFLIWSVALILLSLPLVQIYDQSKYDTREGQCILTCLVGYPQMAMLNLTAFLIPSLLFIFCYARIRCEVRKAYKRIERNKKKSESKCVVTLSTPKKDSWLKSFFRTKLGLIPFDPTKDGEELKILRVMMALFISFVICYFPISFIKIFVKEEYPVLNVMGYLGAYFASCINPFIYIAVSENFRGAYVERFARKPTVTISVI